MADIPADILFDTFSLLAHKPDATLLVTRATSATWHQARCPQAAVLLNVNLVNRAWHAVAQPLIDKTLDLTLSRPNEARNLHVLTRFQSQSTFRARVQHLVVRDVHTQQRVPLGIAELSRDVDWDDSDNEPPAEKEYLSRKRTLGNITEETIWTQLVAVRAAIQNAAVKSFTWTAIPPLPESYANTLAARDIDVHIKLSPYAIDTAAWSWTPVLNYAVLTRLQLIAKNLKSLQLCLPRLRIAEDSMLAALVDLVYACPQLTDLHLHALGRNCTPSLPFSDPVCKGVNGPTRASAQKARTSEYNVWGTGWHGPRPSAASQIFISDDITWRPFALRNLTTLTLRNLCLCNHDWKGCHTIHIPTLRTLDLSCLVPLMCVEERNLPQIQTLRLFLVDVWTNVWTNGIDEPTSVYSSAACMTHWPQSQLEHVLVNLPGLQELQVYGNPESVSELALLHHGNTLRRLALLNREPYDRAVAYNEYLPAPRRMSDLASVIGAACPMLEELSCEAPNASTEFDAFLDNLIANVRNLRSLHIHRSLEPYGDSIPATKLSYARFSKASVALIWSALCQKLPLTELKVTIGSLSYWDDKAESTMIAPNADSRTFVVKRTLSDHGVAESARQDDIVHLEQKEAQNALMQGRPGPLVDYWHIQADRLNAFAAEHNEPIYPKQHFMDGYETRNSAQGAPPGTLHNPDWHLVREGVIQKFRDALEAQHNAEVAEAQHPTRKYY